MLFNIISTNKLISNTNEKMITEIKLITSIFSDIIKYLKTMNDTKSNYHLSPLIFPIIKNIKMK